MSFSTIKNTRDHFTSGLNHIYPGQEIASLVTIVFEHVLGLNRIEQVLQLNQVLDRIIQNQIEKIFNRLNNSEPIQYIIGKTWFYNFELEVNKSVLIPRQETEILIEKIIEYSSSTNIETAIDIGTGSGCIAIALKKNLSLSKITAIDISDSAIETAKKNAKLNNVDIDFLKLDILSTPLNILPNSDLIVSNPPYVLNKEKKQMHDNVLLFEPASALFVRDSDPLVFYSAIVEISSLKLNKGGILAFEINEALGNETLNLIRQTNEYLNMKVIRDLNNKDRIIIAIKK